MSKITERFAELEASLGLPAGFIVRLRDEDDWSFVIKAHALLEAAIAQLLTHEVGKPALEPMFAKANMGGPFGKLALGSALGVIDDQTLRFARALGEMRNAFAHNITNAGLRLKDYLATFDEQQRRAKRDALDMVFERDEIVDGESKISAFDLFCAVPKSIIGGSLGFVLIDIHDRTSVAKVSQDIRRNADKLSRDLYLSGVAGDRVSGTLGSLAQMKKPDADSPKDK